MEGKNRSERQLSPEELIIRIEKALEIARRYGGIDGIDHQNWVINQMVRNLTGPDYEKFVEDAKKCEEGPNTYDWDEGLAP